LQIRIIPVLDSIKEILQSKKLKASSARLLLLKKLSEPQGHYSAEDLFQSLKDTLPGLSLATVYKNLEDLRASGILRMVALPDQVRQYEWERGDHLHLVEGKSLTDLEDTDLFEEIKNLIAQKIGSGFEIENIDVQVFGRKKTTTGHLSTIEK
jgi:Fe2+ or Zn2+ uptake regulation protein